MANRNFASGGKLYSMHVMPVLVDMQFTVDSTQPEGISNLKGPLVSDIFMNSAHATPSMTIAAGAILVQLQDNFNGMLQGMKSMIIAPNSGSDVKIDNSAMTAGVPYVITTLGDATAAKWQAIGVPPGVTPAVGVAFIAASNGGSGNVLTSRVQAAAAAGSEVMSIEMVGQPNKSIAPSRSSADQSYGASMIMQCRDKTGAIAAPVDGSVIQLSFLLSNSSIQIQGE